MSVNEHISESSGAQTSLAVGYKGGEENEKAAVSIRLPEKFCSFPSSKKQISFSSFSLLSPLPKYQILYSFFFHDWFSEDDFLLVTNTFRCNVYFLDIHWNDL